MALFRLGLFLTILLFGGPSLAAITNRTIDDARGDSVTTNPVIYQGVWNSNACPQCMIKPDPAQAFDGTWTETTYFQQSQDPVNATLTFTGTAIYVFFILANNAGPGITSKTAVNITLDNQSPIPFEHTPDISSTDLQYNALVFSKADLENVHHSLIISVSGIQEEIYVNFDYAIYTHEDIVADGAPTANTPGQLPTPISSQLGSAQSSPISFSSVVSAGGSFPIPSTPNVPISAPQSTAPASASPTVPASSKPSMPAPLGGDSGTLSMDPSQTPNTLSPSQHGKTNIVPVGAIIGGVAGGLIILCVLTFSIFFICNKRRQGRWKSIRGSVDLLDGEDGGSGRRITSGIVNIDDDGIDTSIAPFPFGLPSPLPNHPAGIKPSETTAMAYRDSTPPVTLASLMTTRNDAEVAFTNNSGQRMADLRRARQEELDQRLRAMQQEIIEVLNEINDRRASQQVLRPLPIPGQQNHRPEAGNHGGGSTGDQMSVNELQEILRHMTQQIEQLQQQQHSAWAQGLSDDHPPGYTTDTRFRL